MKKIFAIKHVLVPLLILIAFGYSDISLAAQDTVSMGVVAGNIHGSASILARVMWAACVIVGIILFFTAFTQFQTHRQNPKLVPLTTPAAYLILALLALAIPFAERIFGFKDADDQNDQTVESSENYVDIDRR